MMNSHMRHQPAIRFYGPHRVAVWNLCHWIAQRPQRAAGTVVRPSGEAVEGMRFSVPTGCVAVWDMGWHVVPDTSVDILPIVVRSVMGGSLLPDWTER